MSITPPGSNIRMEDFWPINRWQEDRRNVFTSIDKEVFIQVLGGLAPNFWGICSAEIKEQSIKNIYAVVDGAVKTYFLISPEDLYYVIKVGGEGEYWWRGVWTKGESSVDNEIFLEDNTRFPPVRYIFYGDRGEGYEVFLGSRRSKWQVDQTGRRYLNQTPTTRRLQCMALIPATLVIQTIRVAILTIKDVAKCFSFYHFWNDRTITLKKSFLLWSKSLVNIILNILAYVGLLGSAIYGVFRHYDGVKLYALFEWVIYGKGWLAPCFQPDATYHLFGGDINNPAVWW